MAEVNLNEKNLLDYGDAIPFLPFESARYKGKFLGVQFKDGFNGKAYLFKFEIKESTHDQVKAGSQACLRFGLSGSGKKLEITKKKLRSIVAAIAGADPRDESFDATKQLDDLVAAGEAMAEMGVILDIDASCRKATIKEGPKAGEVVERTNYYYKNATPA